MVNEEDVKDRVIDEVNKLPTDEPILFSALKNKAPTLFNEIKEATEAVNKALEPDKKVQVPHDVTITTENPDVIIKKDTTNMEMAASLVSSDHFSHLTIGQSNHNFLTLQGDLQHEISHEAHAKADPVLYDVGMFTDGVRSISNNKVMQTARTLEFMADRGVDTLVRIDAILNNPDFATKNSYNNNTDANRHPNNRARMAALLAEFYGNEIFQNSGIVSGEDGKFYPYKGKDGVPVTQQGERVLNWSALEAAISQQVMTDLKLLDSYTGGFLGFEDSEKKDFRNHIIETQKAFLAQNKPVYGGTEADPLLHETHQEKLDRLAIMFRLDVDKMTVDPQTLADESRMALAYKTSSLIYQLADIDNSLSDDSKRKNINAVHFEISEYIRKEDFKSIDSLGQDISKKIDALKANTIEL